MEQGWTRDLTFLEFFPILVAVLVWGEEMANCMVHFWCDNMVVVQVISSLLSKSVRLMKLVREFTLRCLDLNLLFLGRHVPEVVNGVTDALSHKQMERFHQLTRDADPEPVSVLEELWKIESQKFGERSV